MKRILFFGAAALVVVAMSSCRKNRTCQCTDINGDTDTTPIILSKKKEAQAICDDYESSFYTNCELI
jgi:hypothetical protein